MKSKTRKAAKTGAQRNSYTPQFKEQALALAAKEGIPKAAADSGISEPVLYTWRTKRRQTGQTFEEQKLQQAEIAQLRRDNARLQEEVAFLKKAAAYFAKPPK